MREQGKDDEFTILQGEVYGLRILEAEPSEGMLESIKLLQEQGFKMVLVSHKTEKPYRGPEYNLREAAMKWLSKHSFLDQEGLNWSNSNIYFEDTKEKKVERIKNLRCNAFVDDLEEILQMLPNNIKKILYNTKQPRDKHILH